MTKEEEDFDLKMGHLLHYHGHVFPVQIVKLTQIIRLSGMEAREGVKSPEEFYNLAKSLGLKPSRLEYFDCLELIDYIQDEDVRMFCLKAFSRLHYRHISHEKDTQIGKKIKVYDQIAKLFGK